MASWSVNNGRDPSSQQLAGRLYRSLETSLTRVCARRYKTGVLLRCTEFQKGPATPDTGVEESSEMHIRIEYRDLVQMKVHLRVTALGENRYEIQCGIAEGHSCQFVHRWPEDVDTVLSWTSSLGQSLTAFLLKEVDARIGRFIR